MSSFPIQKDIIFYQPIHSLENKTTDTDSQIPTEENDSREGWICGRGIVTRYIVSTWLESPRIATRILAAIVLGVIVSEVHQIIYYESIEDPKSIYANNSRCCVTSYPSAVAIYNQVNIILNYIMPTLINLLPTIIIIILITKNRANAVAKNTNHTTSPSNDQLTFRSYIDLLIKSKELITAPLITLFLQLFSLPQLILSFALACKEFNIDWQRYLLLISFFIMYLPQVFSYTLHISPSSFYIEEFHATNLYQRISKLQAVFKRRN